MKKILIIRFSSIGDIVLTTPVIRCLRQSLRDVGIHYLTKNTFHSIVADNPIVDKVYSFEKDIHEVIGSLKEENYDYVIDLHRNLRSLRVKIALRAPSRSFPKLNFLKWLLVNLRINKMPQLHIVDRYFKAVEHLGVKNDGQGLDFFIAVKDRVDPVQAFGLEAESYVALVAGAAHFTKRIPLEKLREICSHVNKPVVVLGGREDSPTGQQLEAEFPGKVHSICGKCTLNQSAAVLSKAAHVITADTGLMHIAAAFKRPITVLWGNTVPEFGMYPYLNDLSWQSLEVKGLSCRPCSKIGYAKCPRGHFKCMLEHDISQISA